MDSINSWINEDEVRKLAEYLSASPEMLKEWKDNDFDGFAIPDKQGESHNIAKEVKDSKSISLAGASAMAASAGLLGGGQAVDKEITETKGVVVDKSSANLATENSNEIKVSALMNSDDSYLASVSEGALNEIPVNLDVGAGKISSSVVLVNSDKRIGAFEEIDKQLANKVEANGICVIDRNGDVLYSSMKNDSLVAFTISSMKGTELIKIQEGEFKNIRLKISAEKYIEFISVLSTRGVLILAIFMDQILGDEHTEYAVESILKIANSG